MPREVAGEGTYGCVHKPSIHCKKPPANFSYDNKVSKIMTTNDAEKELAEFVIISQLDPDNEYHLETPTLCSPNLDEAGVKDDIAKCKHIKLQNVEANPQKYSLLVSEYGGIDLSNLCKTTYMTSFSFRKADTFLLNAHHLLKGLKFFKENGLVHNDLKPQNILYDLNSEELKFIDFGLMRRKQQIIDTSKASTNFTGIFHWSYPIDCGLMNKTNYNLFKKLNVDDRYNYMFELQELIIQGRTHTNNYKIRIHNPQAFHIYFSYVDPTGHVPSQMYMSNKIISSGLGYVIDDYTYHNFLNKIIDSIDIYGLGFSLQYVVNCLKRNNFITENDLIKLTAFFSKMYDFDLETRETNIDTLISKYEALLLTLGVLERLDVRFENHNVMKQELLVNSASEGESAIKEANAETKIAKRESKSVSKEKTVQHHDDTTPLKKLSKELEKIAYEDPSTIEIQVKCPESKEFNPNTKRCVTKCKEGYSRNEKFVCAKTQKAKPGRKAKQLDSLKVIDLMIPEQSIRTQKTTPKKLCDDTKEYNQNTKRCVAKCKEGYKRNEKFVCAKTQKAKPGRKAKSIVMQSQHIQKNCGEIKELNPNTNRCVAKCKEGYSRNEKFICIKNKKI
jgi:serine/threonine protein kinase